MYGSNSLVTTKSHLYSINCKNPTTLNKMEEKQSVVSDKVSFAWSLKQASIALAFPCSSWKCEAKLTLALLILLSQQQAQFQAANLHPSPSPTGLNTPTTLLSSAVLWHAQGLELIRHMLQSQTHEWSNAPSQSVTPFSLHCLKCSNISKEKPLRKRFLRLKQLHSDALALQYVVECMDYNTLHANTRLFVVSMFWSLRS